MTYLWKRGGKEDEILEENWTIKKWFMGNFLKKRVEHHPRPSN